MIEVRLEHLALDRAHLEEAVLNQASWYDLYASEYEHQQNKVDRLKNELEYISAQLKIQIRSNADVAKVKMTQDQVDCLLITAPEIKGLKDKILDEEEYLGQLKAAMTAMVHKKTSIEIASRIALSKVSMISGDCEPDTKFAAQHEAVNNAISESMSK